MADPSQTLTELMYHTAPTRPRWGGRFTQAMRALPCKETKSDLIRNGFPSQTNRSPPQTSRSRHNWVLLLLASDTLHRKPPGAYVGCRSQLPRRRLRGLLKCIPWYRLPNWGCQSSQNFAGWPTFWKPDPGFHLAPNQIKPCHTLEWAA